MKICPTLHRLGLTHDVTDSPSYGAPSYGGGGGYGHGGGGYDNSPALSALALLGFLFLLNLIQVRRAA